MSRTTISNYLAVLEATFVVANDVKRQFTRDFEGVKVRFVGISDLPRDML